LVVLLGELLTVVAASHTAAPIGDLLGEVYVLLYEQERHRSA
jgi:hypothetical protein